RGPHPLELQVPAARDLEASQVGERVLVGARSRQLPTHGRAAACIAARREAMNAATLPGAPRASPSSTSRPIALPTITASAKPAIQPACSAVLTPKPTPTGSRVTRRTRLISSGSSRGSAARAPVVPSTETKERKPLAVRAIVRTRGDGGVGA